MKKIFLFTTLAVFSLGSCKALTKEKNNPAIEKGSQVSFDYTLTVDDKVVDTSKGKAPLNYTQGSQQLIPGVEEGLNGMKAGDQKSLTIPPEKGYGPINPKAYQTVSKTSFQEGTVLKVGEVVSGNNNGRPVRAKIVEVTKDNVKLDFNHPLAGKTLTFDITVVSVEPASADRQSQKQPVN